MATSFHTPKPHLAGSGRWAEFIVRKNEIAAQLGMLGHTDLSDIWIASVDNRSVSSVKGDLALTRIAEGSHRLATQEEVAGFHAAQHSREAEYKTIERGNKERDGKGASASEIADALKNAFADPSATPARAGRNKPAGDRE